MKSYLAEFLVVFPKGLLEVYMTGGSDVFWGG